MHYLRLDSISLLVECVMGIFSNGTEGMVYQDCGDSIVVLHPLFPTGEDGSIPISPLQLVICKINMRLAVGLNNLWHSRLPNITNPQGGIYFGAHYENRWYASAIWTMPVAANRLKNGFDCLELRRFAIADNAPKNTATRMISIMVKMIHKERPQIIKLISYQDTDVHNGTIYKASGWVPVETNKYISWTTSTRKRNIEQATGVKIRWGKMV